MRSVAIEKNICWTTHTECSKDKLFSHKMMYLEFFRRKEGNVLFNNALNTFYLRLYGIIHMVKDYTDSERGNPLPPHGLLFLINSTSYLICTIAQTA